MTGNRKPNYYTLELPDGYELEVRLLIEALGWAEGFYNGAALKHLCRAGRKPGQPAIDDLIKARTYLDFEVDRRTREASDLGEPDQPCLDAAIQQVAEKVAAAGRISQAVAARHLRQQFATADPTTALEALEEFDDGDVIETVAEIDAAE